MPVSAPRAELLLVLQLLQPFAHLQRALELTHQARIADQALAKGMVFLLRQTSGEVVAYAFRIAADV